MNSYLAQRLSFADRNFSLTGYWWTDENREHWFVCEGRMTFGISAAGSEISISEGVRFSEKIALQEGTESLFCHAKSVLKKSIEAQRKVQEKIFMDF